MQLCVNDWRCRQYGNTVVPYTDTATSYESANVTLYGNFKKKEDDMCNETKRWNVYIEANSGVYQVRFSHKDKNKSDEFTRSFDSFEQALDFVNETYNELK